MSVGKFAAAVDAGRVFSVSTVVAGLAIPISTTTAPTLALWNQPTSGVRVNLLRYVIAAASGTVAAGVVGFQSAAMMQMGASDVFSAFADSSITNALIGGSMGSRIHASAAGTNTLTAAIVKWTATCFTLGKDVVNTDIAGHQLLSYDFDGLVQLLPSMAIFPCATAATSALFTQTLYWEEVPLAAV